jgi:DNA-binding YbaB/EbfC family protein
VLSAKSAGNNLKQKIMFGKFGDMMGKLQEMKQKADEIKIKLDNTIIHIEGAGGDIKIAITGNREVKSLSISPALQHGDKEELEEQLIVTMNKALVKANEVNEHEMKAVASGMLPGL